ncbi:MAG TPA: tetratricopeptide repeat protein, partial [Thermoanaerobaculia bacterium]|nr:tetratricopeptide repeat protein [Thermoanaerobaculia bacterium]
MARLTKDQLRTDQLQHALTDARDFVSSHRSETTRWVVAGAAVLAAALAVWGGIAWRNERAAGRLSRALAIFDAPLASDPSPAPGAKTYKDAAERTAAARKELQDLVKDSPSSAPGRAAAVLLLGLEGAPAATAANLDAAKALAKSESGTVAGGVAAMAALDAEAAAGRSKEALEAAKKYLDAADSPLPKDLLVYTVAKLYEKNGQNIEAKSFYQRLVTDFPDSPLRTEAQQ